MKYLRSLLYTLLLLYTYSSIAANQEYIKPIIIHNEASVNISNNAFTLEDSIGNISFTDIFTKPHIYTFQKSTSKNLVYIPFGKNIYWIHFQLFNSTNSDQEYLLEVKNATIDELTTYIVSDSMVRIRKHTGDIVNIDPRDIYATHNVTPLTLEPKRIYDIYIRVNSGGDALNIPIFCKRYEKLFYQSNKQNLLIGFFSGLIVTLAIVSLLSIFIQNGGRIFVYFALYAAFNGVWLLYMEGIAYQFLWKSTAEINNLFISFLPLLGSFFFFLFSLFYLRVKDFFPKTYFALTVFCYGGLLSFAIFTLINQIVYSVFSIRILAYVYVLQVTLTLLFLITVLLSIVSIIMIRKNTRSAVFFLAAVIPLILAIELFNMNNLSLDIDITTRNNFTKICLSWQIMILFLAMFDQIRRSQVESARQIEENRKKYFDILENSTEAIFIVQDGLIKFSNTQLSVFLHVTSEALIHLPLELIAHIDDRDMLNKYILERTLEDSEEWLLIFRTNETYNKNSWMELNAVSIQWDGDDAMLCLMNDVSHRIHNEEERKKLEQQLFQSQKMETIGTLAGGVAHEINNILTPILGYSNMLLDDIPEDNEHRSDVEAIRHSAYRAKEVVKQILSFSRQIDINREVITAEKIISMVRPMLQASLNASVTVEYTINVPTAQLHVNVTQIEQILINLCNNANHAIKHSNGHITIKVELADGSREENKAKLKPIMYVCFSVIDNGSGMSEETLARIFEPFFTTKKVGEGTGLGLSVVHGIVKNHGGIINVKSTLGKGSCFDIYLPLHIHKGDILSELKTSQQNIFGTESILVIDDESEITSIIKRALTHLGYKVTTYVNSLEALREVERNPLYYELIICDLHLPRLSGRELMNSTKEINPQLKYVILTGMFEQQIDYRLFPQENCIVMTKPIDLKELSVIIRQLLDKH